MHSVTQQTVSVNITFCVGESEQRTVLLEQMSHVIKQQQALPI